ncbi:MAG: VOC family protein [Cyclobacteriaceae bacterium]|nr:VOC family protein [Cyclobacteriaceae bacterium]
MRKLHKLWGSKINTLLVLSLIALVAFRKGPSTEKNRILPNDKVVQIGIVVPDIEEGIDKWVEMLGLEVRPTVSIAAGHEDNPTQYRGKPSKAKAKLAFINTENIVIELIEPMGDEESYWKAFLDEHGPSVHHIGVNVKDLSEKYVPLFEEAGYPLVQHGGWDGGEYGYMDSQKGLGVIIELLEHYSR